MRDPGSRQLILAILGIIIVIAALAAIAFAFSRPDNVLPSPSALPGASPVP